MTDNNDNVSLEKPALEVVTNADKLLLEKEQHVSKCTKKRKFSKLGPFLLLKTIGVGEFGKVKLGRHVETSQIVAIKLVNKEAMHSTARLEKLRKEIDILKRLDHPHIVKLLCVNETNTNIGMVLEYAQGGELFEHIYRQRYLKEEDARRLFSQLISCVNYLHQENIVHRDLKLENILLDCHNNVIVTDFGFANDFTEKTSDLMSTACGSPVYAAPELVMTGKLYAGKGVDIWSCGIILFAMLCGYLPFDDESNSDDIGRLYRYISTHKPKFPSHVSPDARDIIGKMLIPDPRKRYNISSVMSHPWLRKYKDDMQPPLYKTTIKKPTRKPVLSATIPIAPPKRHTIDLAVPTNTQTSLKARQPSLKAKLLSSVKRQIKPNTPRLDQLEPTASERILSWIKKPKKLDEKIAIVPKEKTEAPAVHNSGLRVHTGSMNHCALTTQEPLNVILELSKILLVLGIEVQNKGGYKLHCVRPSIQQKPDLQSIYGHSSIDNGSDITFTIEICRFENLPGLFSIELDYLSKDNYTGYQFIVHKLQSLLSIHDIIKNNNNLGCLIQKIRKNKKEK